MLVRIGIAAAVHGVSASTLRRWEKEERMQPVCRTKGGHRRYKLIKSSKEQENQQKVVIGYARVSAAKQRQELSNQQEQIKNFVEQQGWKLKRIFTDIASGMNEQRKGLLKLLKEVATTHPHTIICTYEDRVARFGTKVIQHFCQIFDSEILAIHQQQQFSNETKLVEDMMQEDYTGNGEEKHHPMNEFSRV